MDKKKEKYQLLFQMTMEAMEEKLKEEYERGKLDGVSEGFREAKELSIKIVKREKGADKDYESFEESDLGRGN